MHVTGIACIAHKSLKICERCRLETTEPTLKRLHRLEISSGCRMRFPIEPCNRPLSERVIFPRPFKFRMDSPIFWCSKLVKNAQVHGKDNSLAGDPARFHTTRWSVVVVAAQSEMAGSRAALSDAEIRALCDAIIAAEGRT
jgi:hypothetical protein